MPRRWIIGVSCLLLALALGGCSAVRFGYNQAPELAYWWLDGYADFDDTQSPRVRDALARWFAWHRRTQLPDYAALLARAQVDVLADTTPDRACGWWTELRNRMDTAFDQAIPLAAEIAVTLSPEQLRHIERRYAKANEEFREEYLAIDAKERLAQSVKRAIERAENIYGRLDEAQRERVAQSIAASPFDAELWLSERKRRQQDALQMLTSVAGETNGRERAEAGLRAWRERIERSPRDTYRRYTEKLTQFNCSFSAALHNSTSAAQRQTAVSKLKGWEGDVRALAGAANGAGR
jgi:Family of unknown function (DUF6279)